MINTRDAIGQLVEAISKEYGSTFKSKGFLIGVKGTQWTIMDYHLVITQGNNNPQYLISNFYDASGSNTAQPERPTPSKEYRELEYMDVMSQNESTDLVNALRWIANGNEAKDLTFMMRHATHLPVTLSVSTMSSLGVGRVEEEEEEESEDLQQLQDEYAHLVPLFRGGYMETVDTMEMDD